MTLTISAEEAKAYAAEMEKWTRRRGQYIAEWLFRVSPETSRERFEEMLKQYDKMNPVPTLFPKL